MTRHIEFFKMHGLGNDFVILNHIKQPFDIASLPIKQWANRHTGIGFDQALILCASNKANFGCRIINSDGSEAEQCGNGMRCIARYIHEYQLHDGMHYTIETKAGIVSAVIHDYDHIQISMGIPEFKPALIPLDTSETKSQYEIELPDLTHTVNFAALSMGNPHAIITVSDIKSYPITTLGPVISTHAMFPHGTNVGFMEILQRNHIRLRTYERGSGETLACGSNSCAAVVAGITSGLLDKKVTVELALGKLQIEWQGDQQPVSMTGPATMIYQGTIALS